MTRYPDDPMPARPFISCTPEELTVVDQAAMHPLLRGGKVEPWARLSVGAGNILESPPEKVLNAESHRLVVQCRDARVTLDFSEETAEKVKPDGERFVYMGGIEDANDGRGWIPVS